ncbi:MAG: hypothetical protein HUU20_12650 [Pirellulales bacterium]|nr:hypothetical protein [Pirellulales bacterium]
MMSASRSVVAAVLALVALCLSARADEAEKTSAGEKYTLRYKFSPAETIRWEVVHRAKIRTTVSGTTQTAETVSSSVKVWRVTGVDDAGAATFENMVDSVDMSQKLTGRAEVRYNSQSDKEPPPGFENVAASLGVALSVITMDDRGKIVQRQQKQNKAATSENEGQITIPLPEQPIAAGETWSFPYDVDVPLPNGTIKKVKAQQKYTLTEVKEGIAFIEVTTQILTPIHDPAVEAQLIQRESHGTVKFDVEAGRVVGQQMDLDRRVVGFRGEASSLHYVMRFTEDLITGQEAKTASRPETGTDTEKK